tara:strand:- start:44 stop:1231 length:1188 start_codon:yes stop_codon:yes gene_type:complete
MNMDATGSKIEHRGNSKAPDTAMTSAFKRSHDEDGQPVDTPSAYDFEIASADGTNPDILADCIGKVTLVFNIAGGCGNYPQLVGLKALDDHYKDEPDFQMKAIVVDDFTCHGYGEFNDGLEAFAQNENTDESYRELGAGQISEKYARENYDVEFEFSECINGRFDKHVYDPEWRPGGQYQQEMHPFWQNLVGCTDLPRDENNLPHHQEASPWSAEPQEIDMSQPGFFGLQGNFEKFLIGRDGKTIRRYANGFLLGERQSDGRYFSWWRKNQDVPEPDPSDSEGMATWFDEDGKIRPEVAEEHHLDEDGRVRYPSPMQERGIEISLDLLCEDIDNMLAGKDVDRDYPGTEEHPVYGESVGRVGYANCYRPLVPPTQTAIDAQKEYGDRFEVGQGVQ